MSARRPQSLSASPTLVGAVTTLIVVLAVFLSYNANNGLPFVPVYRVSLEVPSSARLTPGNEVRIGGHRVGVVESVEPVAASSPVSASTGRAPRGGRVAARITLKLDRSAAPLPRDSIFRIRYLSTFGLKYVEVVRGTGASAPEGFTFDGTDDPGTCRLPVNPERFASGLEPAARNGCFTPQAELDDLTNLLDRRARGQVRVSLAELGDATAGRGGSVAEAIAASPPLLRDLGPVLRAIADPDTRLERLLTAGARTASVLAGVSDELAGGFGEARTAFAALSADPEALRDSISGARPLLERSLALLPGQRSLLADVGELARRLRPGARQLPPTLPVLNEALALGRPVLDRVPRSAHDLRAALVELRRTIDEPATGLTLDRLDDTLESAFPAAAYIAPTQTVCNYPTYLFTFLAEHLGLRSTVGFTQRNSVALPYPPDPGDISFGGVEFDFPGAARSSITGYTGISADGLAGSLDPSRDGLFDPRELPIAHGPVNAPTGQLTTEFPDCAVGQFGYPLGTLRLPGQPPEAPGIGIGDYPGSRGPTTLFLEQDGTRRLRDTRVPSRSPETWGLGAPTPVPQGLTR